jgi:hypothetical protein
MKGLLVVLPLCVGLLSMVANQLRWIVIGEIEIEGRLSFVMGNVVYYGLLWGVKVGMTVCGVGVELEWSWGGVWSWSWSVVGVGEGVVGLDV